MGKENHKKAQVISFLSGKGGAGKTSAAIGASHLLSDAGFKVVLIDFDFATNGASYFYKHFYPSHKEIIGIYEMENGRGFQLDVKSRVSPKIISLEIREGLHFIPTRVNFSKKLPLRDEVAWEEKYLKSFLLYLIEYFQKDCDFIIIDNQAGSNLTAKVSSTLSDKVIIVSELDAISSDAVDTLLIQIGDAFPEYRRYLINKLDVRESEDYKKLSTLFTSMNRLPPLPFDFEVRSAFASRQIPINVDKPTTFLIALFNTVKAFLPEYKDQIEKYGQEILSKYSHYQDIIDSLLDRKNELERQFDIIRSRREKTKFTYRLVMSVLGMNIGIALLIALGSKSLVLESRIVAVVLGIPVVFGSFSYLLKNILEYRESAKFAGKVEKLRAELSDIEKEIDRHKSLMLTRTKEFLLTFERSE